MAINLINKYVWLVETIYKAGRITLDEINEKWLEQGMDNQPIPPRTFHKWRIAAEEMFNLNIECERKGGYHYYIENPEELKRNSIRNWILNSVSVSNLLLDNQSLKNRILLEDIPSGHNNLVTTLDAMKTNTQISITYQSYWKEDNYTFTVHPYCIKLFKQRWYMPTFNPYYNKMMIYALDRISNIQKLDGETFNIPEDFDAESFFYNYYGIIVNSDSKLETVKLKVSADQANYLRSLPLHDTQKEIERNDEYSIFSLRICPQFDFYQEILSNGEDIEVLEPAWLRETIAGIVKRMWNKYKE
ncbi:MAG: WYL domain-containing protein [Bacteroidales bacterium]|jgi:hypothetical protein